MRPRKRTGGRTGAAVKRPWFVQYRRPDGTQKSPGFTTFKAAQAFCDTHGPRIRAGRALVPLVAADSTVGQYGPHWLAAIRPSIKPRAHEHYAAHFARYLDPRLGPRPIAELTRPECRAFLVACREAGVAGHTLRPGSVYAIYATLRALLNAAVEDGLRHDNPAARLGKPLHLHPTKKARAAAILKRALDRERLYRLLEHTRTAEPEWYPLVLLLPRTGLRLGEALALELEDYNPTARTLDVVRAWDAKHGRLEEPKHGARVVDVSPQLAAILDAHVAALSKVVGLDGAPVVRWLFPSEAGTMLDGRNVRRTLARLAARAALGRGLGPHDLRHTFGSQLIATGKSPVYVQRQMGHASVQTTVDLYGSGLPLEERAGVAALDDLASNVRDGGTMVVRGGTGPRGKGRT
jgi:integrase